MSASYSKFWCGVILLLFVIFMSLYAVYLIVYHEQYIWGGLLILTSYIVDHFGSRWVKKEK